MIKNTLEKKEAIQSIVRTAVEAYATGFRARHEGEVDNPNGVINMKIHNVFIAALGKDIQYYSALVRSLDSSLGNMLEGMAINIAKLFYEVNKSVEGELYPEQTSKIAEFLEAYKNSKNPLKPSIEHFKEIRSIKPNPNSKIKSKVHVSDYYLIDKETNTHHLIELKIGGDLDNKKARSEKEAIFEQFAILANSLGKDATIKAHFATAYNRFGEDNEWKQGRVLQFFSKDELLIGRDFWNFVCKSEKGYELVLETYKENAHLITTALEEIKKTYLD
ncbi:restriction endonuclease [Candidatus Uhrbacteria bacterium CG22_combo_CG10-13_8_21_14_all_47_17]|uniref:type II site-specific deoxyribonuclease n=1 Tax=Candidatus Uhrbacteria bacterium CG22_combo_CG10-13_8_21_14_all_47_17 TaxID=1975041 RepID=A0A2H0BRP4_9BACT|nr:MAG: restriction endonuclease [Candidatus Uhrbacteria bacterium CG22_combo_CG10-13_8_21_14_all_47_17]